MGYSKLLGYKRNLRIKSTKAERKIKRLLYQLHIRFVFQRILVKANAIVDFLIPDMGLIIEIDGDYHNFQKAKDENRTRRIYENYPQLSLIRIPNSVVYRLTKTPLKAIIWSKARKNAPILKLKRLI